MLAPHSRVVVDLINEYKFKEVAEIGVLEGITVDAVHQNCPSIEKYYMIDPWVPFKGDGAGKSANITAEEWEVIYQNILDKYATDPKFIIMRATSVQAAKAFEPSSLDLVFIDSIHSYKSCKSDVQTWFPIVRPGGILCGDDYNSSRYPSVTTVINEIFKGRVTILNHRVWAVRRGKT